MSSPKKSNHKKQIAVSVIIPVYNQAENLKKLLADLTRQAPKNWEIIVIDDASTDETPKIAKKFLVRYHRFNKNQGPAAARNQGTKMAQGEILVFFDADVLLCKNTLKEAISPFKKDPKLAAVSGIWTKTSTKSSFFSQYKALRDWSYFFNEATNKGIYYFTPRVAAIKKSVFFKVGGFNIRYRDMEDLEFSFRLEKLAPIHFNPKFLVEHQFKGALTQMKNYFKRTYSFLDIFFVYRRFCRTVSTPKEALNVILAAFLLFIFISGFFFPPTFILLPLTFVIYLYRERKFLSFFNSQKGFLFTLKSFIFNYLLHLVIFVAMVSFFIRTLFKPKLVNPLLILLATFGASHIFHSWVSFPRGHDALFHIFKVEYLLQNWPHHHWWSIWAGGMPLFLYYPPLPHYFLALVKLLSGASFELVLNISAILAIGFSALAIYLLLFRLTKNRIFSFIGSLLYLTCPSSWEAALNAGVYVRALAIPCFTFGLYFSILFWQKYESGVFDNKFFVLTSIFWGLSVLTHQHVALLGYATFAFLTFFIIKGKILAKTMTFFKVVFLSLLLSATFWLPLLAFFPQSPTATWISSIARTPVPLKDLISFPNLKMNSNLPLQNYANFGRLTPFLLPLAIFLAILTLIFKLKRLRKNDLLIKILKFSGWMTLFWVIYANGSLLRFEKSLPLITTIYSFMGTLGATWFMPIFIALAIGILLSLLLAKKKRLSLLVAGILVLCLTFYMKEQYIGISRYFQKTNLSIIPGLRDFYFASPALNNQIEEQQDDNFRLAIGEDSLTFNHQFPDFSQTGHYFIQAVPNFDLYFYFENSLWKKSDNENETRFLLDWWAIKTIVASSKLSKFNQEGFNQAAQKEKLTLWTYENPSPLLSPSQAPTILTIGDQKSFQTGFFRALAIGNLGSQLLIPIRGKSTIEDYTWEGLAEFDLVFLYDYQVRKLPWAAKVLENYVENGGSLIIESNREFETGQDLPDPFPINKVSSSIREANWDFQIQPETSLINQADLKNFSPAKYENDAWGISEGVEVKPWAKTILTSNRKPILVEGRLGKGRVLWSGINLPFHITQFKNSKEAQLLKKILTEFSFIPQDSPQFQTEFKNPQEKVITLQGEARGVLLKENYFPNWRAIAKTPQKKNWLKIYSVGPGFMYAYLPKGTTEVVFLYRRSWLEKLTGLISLLTFFWLIYNLLSATTIQDRNILDNPGKIVKIK